VNELHFAEAAWPFVGIWDAYVVPSERRRAGYVLGVGGTFDLGVAEPRPFAGGSDVDDIERRTW
jgi:hypothetical protein